MKIILASASPRRRELLTQIGLEYEVMVSDTEERAESTEPAKVVEELARQKAENVCQKLAESQKELVQESSDGMAEEYAQEAFAGQPEKHEREASTGQPEELLVISADTIVACQGRILGKPGDEEAAKAMLRLLQGGQHEVYTGVTLLYRRCPGEPGQMHTLHEVTRVRFYPMTEEEIADYVATGDPLDKAGAYGIQGLCARYISGIEGDYNNVVGLPVGRLYQELKGFLQAGSLQLGSGQER